MMDTVDPAKLLSTHGILGHKVRERITPEAPSFSLEGMAIFPRLIRTSIWITVTQVYHGISSLSEVLSKADIEYRVEVFMTKALPPGNLPSGPWISKVGLLIL